MLKTFTDLKADTYFSKSPSTIIRPSEIKSTKNSQQEEIVGGKYEEEERKSSREETDLNSQSSECRLPIYLRP